MSWRDDIDEEDALCMACPDSPTTKDLCGTNANVDRVDEWLNNKRIVTKNDPSVCFICLRYPDLCEESTNHHNQVDPPNHLFF